MGKTTKYWRYQKATLSLLMTDFIKLVNATTVCCKLKSIKNMQNLA